MYIYKYMYMYMYMYMHMHINNDLIKSNFVMHQFLVKLLISNLANVAAVHHLVFPSSCQSIK